MLMYLLLAVLGLHCCAGFYLAVVSWGCSIVWCASFSWQGLLLLRSSGCGLHRLQYLRDVGSVAVPGLWSTDAVVVAHRLRCAAACGVFPYQRSCIPRWLLYHWAPGKPIWPFLTEINIAFPYESVTTHLDLYIIDLKMYAHTKLCAFVATVFCNFLSAPCGM